MPSERIPVIDPDVKHIGISKLRGLNATTLKKTTETFVIQENDKPLAVLLTYDKFLAMQDELKAVARTVAMLSDDAEMDALTAGLDDLAAGRVQSLDEIDEELKKGRG